MQYSLSNRLSSNVSSIDADARLYIAAVETALGTPIATALPSATSNPKRIISDFIKAEKAASRWSLHKRIYLPIYNNAAASAIDMVSRLSGTFTGLGSVTHAAGYVQGNGTSGYFDSNSSPNSLGLIDGSASIFVMARTSVDSTYNQLTGNFIVGKSLAINRTLITTWRTGYAVGTSGEQNIVDDTIGILHAVESSTNFRELRKRNSAGVNRLASNTTILSGSYPTASQFFMARRISGGAAVNFSSAQLAAFGMGVGFLSADSDAFTANLKTLWESLTGLTLP